MSQGKFLVYHDRATNDAYAYFLTGQKPKRSISPSATVYQGSVIPSNTQPEYLGQPYQHARTITKRQK